MGFGMGLGIEFDMGIDMEMSIGIGGFIAMFVLIGLRFPIALAMLLVGGGGTVILVGWKALLGKFYADPYYLFTSHYLAVIPLFLLMGQFAFHSGMSHSLFVYANKLLGRRRGGVAMAVIGACAVFGSICGSSIATAATMGRVALPEMKRLNYSKSLAAGSVAVGGTLGTLIPPSIVLIIYAVLTEQNLVKMFLAALVPGIIAVVGYFITIMIVVRLVPTTLRAKDDVSNKTTTQNGGGEERKFDKSYTLEQRQIAETRTVSPSQISSSGETTASHLPTILPTILVLALVIGGIYVGVFTANEGAAIGCILTAAMALFNKRLSFNVYAKCMKEAALTTGMIYMVLLGAAFFSSFLALTQLPASAAAWVGNADLHPYLVLALILGLYIVLGCIMDTIAMLILTLPIFFPIVLALDFGMSPEEVAIWFGILTLITVEMGLITPPIGLNIFVINSLDKDISTSECFRGVIPFLLSDILRVILLIAAPTLTLGVVRWLAG